MRRASITMCGISQYPPSEWTAFARFPPWMWRNDEVRDFVDWLREHNGRWSKDKRVAFHGLDLYSLYNSIRSVLKYLDEVDPQTARVARERYGCLTPWQRDPATYGHAALTGTYRDLRADVVAHAHRPLASAAAYAEHDGERFLDADAERAAGRQCGTLLPHHVLRLARVLESARQPHVRNPEERCWRFMAQTARRSSGRTTRMSAMPARPRCRRAASSISVSSAGRNSANRPI